MFDETSWLVSFSHIFGSGDLLDRRKEAERFGVVGKDNGKAGTIVNRGQSRKPSLKYIVY